MFYVYRPVYPMDEAVVRLIHMVAGRLIGPSLLTIPPLAGHLE